MAKLWSLRGLSWRELAKRTCRKSWEDEIFGQSARMAFYFFFALFPVLLLLSILLGKTVGGASDWRDALLDSFKQVLPPDASALMMQTIQQISRRAVLGSGAILAAVYAAWGSLNGTWAMMTGLNKAYEVEEKRSWWRILLIMFSLTISLSVLGLIALAAIVFGNRAGKIIGQHLGAPAHFDFLWRIVQWALIVTLLFFSFSVLYRFGPNLRDRRWQWSIPGAVVAVTLWVPSTLLLRVHQEDFGSSRIYGKLNSVATLLLWLYLTGAAIFVGGEANSEIEKAAAEAGHPDVRGAGERRSGGADISEQ
ncbi:MAG TPA: YihY/virulence factor BrkB family protein [Bryobacteraceae bacterium]|nr:YihY/virulence factor BrkB family protein [Bryobacteraceae bacterium]